MVEKGIPLTEDEAVTRCQAGDRDAFRFLVDRYQNILYGTAFLMMGDKMAAEDQVQEAFISAWKGIRTFQSGYPFKPWLIRILVNRVISYRRNHIKTDNVHHAVAPIAPETTEKLEIHDQLERALNRLSEEQRQVILLRYFTGLTLTETSSALGRPEGTIKSQAHRALGQLKFLIDDGSGLIRRWE
jgi:RNA polymerase sigma-70 factor, ECF subfamily